MQELASSGDLASCSSTCAFALLSSRTDLAHSSYRMPVTKADVVRLIKKAAQSPEEKFQLLALAGEKPSLWSELDEEDVVGCLRAQLRKEGRQDRRA